MGRASSSKKVTRVAQTGGGRTARGARPYLFYVALAAIAILGVAGVVFSREQRIDKLAAGSNATPPVVNQDHWHAAYGVYICDSFAEPITDQRDPKGIHTHADGVIHIHPFLRSAAGRNATLEVFADAVRMDLNDTTIQLPGGEEYTEGDDECDGKDAKVMIKVNDDEPITENVAQLKMNDRDLITIAFVPEGTEIPPPPSAPNLDNLSDVPSSGSATSTVSVPTSAAEGESTTTSAPAEGGDTTTSAP